MIAKCLFIVYDFANMKIIFDNLKDKGADKVAFLLILVLCVFAAKLLVASRSRIKLSEPVKIQCCDLRVGLPTGQNWRNQKQWWHDSRQYFVASVKYDLNGRATTLLRWVYHLDLMAKSLDETLKGSIDPNQITDYGELEVGQAVFHWIKTAPVQTMQGSRYIYNGNHSMKAVAELGQGRWLELSVETIEDGEIAEKVFNSAVKSLTFSDNSLLADGTEFVSSIKKKGVDFYCQQYDGQRFFVIKDKFKQNMGFSAELLSFAFLDDNTKGIKITSVDYLKSGGKQLSRNIVFSVSPSLDKFLLKSKFEANQKAPKMVEITLKDNLIKVNNFDSDKEQEFVPGKAAISEQLYAEIASALIQSSYEQAVVDIIDNVGRIIPTVISKRKLPDLEYGNYAVKFESMDGSDNVDEIHIDSQGQIFKMHIAKDKLIAKRSTSKEISEIFPMWQNWLESIKQN